MSRKFHTISEAKLSELKQKQIKKRSFAKMQWAVRAFKDWHNVHLRDITNFDINILETDLDNVPLFDKDKFKYSMCRFIPEVRKIKDGSDFPGATLYQLCIAIQSYINENGKNWKIVDGPEFKELRNVLDNVMKERALINLGTVKKQANVISTEFEAHLWDSGILGEDNPDKLRSTVLFLLGIHLGL